MKKSDFTPMFPEAWGASADARYMQFPVPASTTEAGRASLDLGFPPSTMTPPEAGGSYPSGADVNGGFRMCSTAARNYEAGIIPPHSQSYAQEIGGYPSGARVADTTTLGAFWVSTADDNLTTPGAEGATWVSLFSDYYTKAQSDQALAARTGRLIAVTSIITHGTSTWTPNPLTTRIVVEVLGGGGAGGGTEATSSSQQAVAWGGTGGDYAKSGLVPLAQISSPVTVTVGAGGAAVAGSDGNPGLTSSFGSYLTAPGGQGGYKGYANTVGQSIGADMPVSPDGSGSIMMLSQRGAGGGGPLALGTQITTRGGYGGRSFMGPGGGGTTGAGSTPNVGSFGGGGGGQAVGPSANNPLPGAAGGDGCVIIWEYA